jgi:spermidine synthase
MKQWIVLDEAETPDGSRMILFSRNGRYTIRVNGIELMSTHQHGSEEKLAELACAHIAEKSGARVLIGGLGFGFTLKAALTCVPADAKVIVAEIMPTVIAWNKDPALKLSTHALADRRVEVIQELRQHPARCR